MWIQIAFMFLLFTGLIMNLVANIAFIIAAFRTAVGWGLAVIFIPLANLAFLFVHWREARQAFILQVVSVLMLCGAAGLAISQGVTSRGDSAKLLPAMLAEKVSAIEMPERLAQADAPESESASDDGNYVGMTIAEVTAELGHPKGRLKTGGNIILSYPELELTSSNGKTITHQGKPAE